MDLAALRKEYQLASLDLPDVDPDPVRQFEIWFEQARRSISREANAMALGTVGPDGRPSVRMVLLKSFDAAGFVFFTNYTSRKGRDLAANPHAALCFHWGELERQVRIEGPVTRTSREESIDYFNKRPFRSRIGAAVSEQSQIIAGRRWLETEAERLEAEYAGGAVPVPENWGGYRVEPVLIEFWQGRENRLHDRLQYRREKELWIIERLAP